jgi:hypothetical protein
MLVKEKIALKLGIDFANLESVNHDFRMTTSFRELFWGQAELEVENFNI